MIGNISKSKGFKGDPGPLGPQGPQGEQGIQGEKGDSPAIVLRLDDAGNLYYNSDGILVDKEYVESQNLVTKDEMKDYIDEEVDIIKSDVEGLQRQLNEEAHFRGYLSTNAKIQALEATPNDFAYSAESGTKWVYDVENGWQDTGTPVPDQLTPASDATPLINGTASAGTANEYARGDHRHPTDTTRVSVEEFNKFKSENAKNDFELIASGETTEEVNGIVISTDNDGNTFELCDMINIYAYCPKTSNSASKALTVNFNNVLVHQTNTNALNTNENRSITFRSLYTGHVWDSYSATATGGAAQVYTTIRTINSGANAGNLVNTTENNIKRIKLYVYESSLVLPAGFKYYIYGRRVKNANA